MPRYRGDGRIVRSQPVPRSWRPMPASRSLAFCATGVCPLIVAWAMRSCLVCPLRYVDATTRIRFFFRGAVRVYTFWTRPRQGRPLFFDYRRSVANSFPIGTPGSAGIGVEYDRYAGYHARRRRIRQNGRYQRRLRATILTASLTGQRSPTTRVPRQPFDGTCCEKKRWGRSVYNQYDFQNFWPRILCL